METVTAAKMQYAGTSPDKKSYKKDYGIAEFESGGMRIVFVAFTKGLGNLRLPDGAEYAVNLLYEDYDTNYTQVATAQIESVMAAARKHSPDVLIALVHWGAEDDSQHSQTQERIADLLVANGADVILGSHSHQPGPIETRTATDENGDEHTALVAYDLGDFYTASDKSARQGIVLQLEFTKDKRGSVQLTKQRRRQNKLDPAPGLQPPDHRGKHPVDALPIALQALGRPICKGIQRLAEKKPALLPADQLPTRPLLRSQIGDLLRRAWRAGAIAQPMPAGHAARGENLLLMRRGDKRIPLRRLRVEQLLQLFKLPAGKAFV